MRRDGKQWITGLALAGLIGLTGASTLLAAVNPEPGDLNENGIFDFDDVAILRSILGGAPHRYTREQLDVNGDGSIDQRDLDDLRALAERQAGGGGPAPTPQPAPTPVLRGDLDGNGRIDDRDLYWMTEVLRHGVKPPNGAESADVDADRKISVADLVALIEILQGRRTPTYV